MNTIPTFALTIVALGISIVSLAAVEDPVISYNSTYAGKISNVSAGANISITWFDDIAQINSSGGGGGASSLSQLTIDTNKDWLDYDINGIDNLNTTNTINIIANYSNPFNHYDGNNYNPIYVELEDNTSADGTYSPFFTIRAYGYYPVPGFRTQSARGNKTNPQAIDREFPMLRFSAAGYNGAAFTGSKGMFDFWSSEAWNTTSNPTYFLIATTAKGSTTVTNRLKVNDTGVMKVYNLAGSGNNIIKADVDGNLFRNDTAGAGITLRAPNGNYFCTTVSNAGALTTVSGACP